MQFIIYNAKNSYKNQSLVVTDYISHSTNYKQYMGDTLTNSCHENVHKINSDLRNAAYNQPAGDSGPSEGLDGQENPNVLESQLEAFNDILHKGGFSPTGLKLFEPNNITKTKVMGDQYNAFYLGQNRAIYLYEPHFRKSQIADFIPTKFRKSRFGTYITGQKEWDSTPLYVFDEWVAYCAGTDAAIDLSKIGNQSPQGTDIASGPAEFTAYAAAVVLAAQKYDPDYFKREPKFLPFVQWNAQRALELSSSCQNIFPWTGLNTLINDIKSEPTFKILFANTPDLPPDNFNIFR